MGPSAPTDASTGSDDRRRWLVVAVAVAVVAVGAGAATLSRSPPSDGAAVRDDDVAIPDRGDLQDPDGQQPTEGPQVTCERKGEPADCVAWTRRLDSAGAAPDLLAGRDLATGEDLWQGDAAEGERLVHSAAIPRSSVSRYQRVFSFVPRDRRVRARDPGTGEILWQTQLDPHVGHVSTVDGAIVARVSEATSVQVDPPTGRVRGTVTTTSDGRPALVAGDVLVDLEAGWAAGVDLFD